MPAVRPPLVRGGEHHARARPHLREQEGMNTMVDNPFVAIGKLESELTARIHALEQRDAELRSTLKNIREGIAAREKEFKNTIDNLGAIATIYNTVNNLWRDNFKVFVQVVFNFLAGMGHVVPPELEKEMYKRMKLPDKVVAVKKLEDL
jgi:uncharacterized coiled-coil protein SlyX